MLQSACDRLRRREKLLALRGQRVTLHAAIEQSYDPASLVANTKHRQRGIEMRFKQRIGTRGSLKWIQRAVNEQCQVIDTPILSSIPGASHIEWLSPLSSDEFAEYRDNAFLQRIGHIDLADALAAFRG